MDNYYWLFSALAQTTAVFVGLIYAGVTFLYGRIDGIVRSDATLGEIYGSIKQEIRRRLKRLLAVTLVAIALCLTILAFNETDWGSARIVVSVCTCAFCFTVMILSVAFALKVVDPDQVRRTARALLAAEKGGPPEAKVPTGLFLHHYDRLAALLKELARDTRILDRDSAAPPKTLKETVERLSDMAVVERSLADELLQLDRVRNLAVHGRLKSLEKKYDDALTRILSALQAQSEKTTPTH